MNKIVKKPYFYEIYKFIRYFLAIWVDIEPKFYQLQFIFAMQIWISFYYEFHSTLFLTIYDVPKVR